MHKPLDLTGGITISSPPTTVARLIASTIENYQNCVIHLVDFEGLLDFYSPPSLPVRVDNWALTVKRWKHALNGGRSVFFSASTQLQWELESQLKPRMGRNNSRVLKIRNFFCFMTFLLASDLKTFSISYVMGPIEPVIRLYLHQDFTLGIQLPWLNNRNTYDMKHKPLRFFVETFIVFDYSKTASTSRKKSLPRMIDELLTSFSDHLPPILFLTGSSDPTETWKINCNYGFITCPHYTRCDLLPLLSCEELIANLESI